jgi:hypothetical protein
MDAQNKIRQAVLIARRSERTGIEVIEDVRRLRAGALVCGADSGVGALSSDEKNVYLYSVWEHGINRHGGR